MERTDNGEDRGRHRRDGKGTDGRSHERPATYPQFRTNTTAARHMATRKRTARHSDTARHGISRHHGARHDTAYPGTMVRGEFIYGMARGTTVRDNTARHDTRHDGARQYEIRHDTTCGTMVRDIRHDMTRGMMARDNTARHDDTACGTMVRDNTARHDDTTCGTMVRDNTNEYGTKHGTIRYAARWRATIRTNTARDMARNTIRGTRCATIRTNEYGMKYEIRREILYAAQWCASELMARADSPEIKIRAIAQ